MSSAAPPKHDWSLPERGGLQIEDENEYAGVAGSAPILTVDEAERYVESLRKFSLGEVGTSKWLDQHTVLVRLNLQAHQCAMQRTDEFVLEALLTFGKVSVLIHELLVIEAWKEFVFPLLLKSDCIAGGKRNMRLYFTLYHEATLTNLLEVVTYHKHVCEEIGDSMVDIADYCVRKLVTLNSTRRFSEPKQKEAAKSAKELADQLSNLTRVPIEEIKEQADEVEFRVCIAAVGLLRFICEHLRSLPLSVAPRLLDTHDVLLGLVPLIDNPPWTRRLESGKWQKFIDFRWQEVKPADLLKITRLEAQVWLSIYHLTMPAEWRQRYHFNAFRKGNLLRARKFINEVMLDQLPVLADVQRYMDELAIMNVPEPTQELPLGGLLMEQVPQVRDSIVRGVDWESATKISLDVFSKFEDSTDADLRRIGQLYQEDQLEEMLDPSSNGLGIDLQTATEDIIDT